MSNFDKKPEGMSYGDWLREKNIDFRMKMAIHTDTGIPMEFRVRKVPEIYERALDRQGGKKLDPEDIGNE